MKRSTKVSLVLMGAVGIGGAAMRCRRRLPTSRSQGGRAPDQAGLAHVPHVGDGHSGGISFPVRVRRLEYGIVSTSASAANQSRRLRRDRQGVCVVRRS